MPTLIDALTARPEFGERHEIVIAASRERVWEALTTLDLADIKAARPLFAVRGVLGRLRNGHRPRDRATFTTLATDPGREVVQGIVGRWWKLGAEQNVQIADRSEFESFDSPGYAKATFGFLLLDHGQGRIKLVTQTRVVTTSHDAHRAMARYWLLIRPGSGLIRWLILLAVRAKATR
jgi:hypothetical protein